MDWQTAAWMHLMHWVHRGGRTTRTDPVLSRLYSKGRVLGHKRGKRNSTPNTSLIQIEGVATKEDAQFYLGKVRTSQRPSTRAVLTQTFHSVSHMCTRPRRRFGAQRSG